MILDEAIYLLNRSEIIDYDIIYLELKWICALVIYAFPLEISGLRARLSHIVVHITGHEFVLGFRSTSVVITFVFSNLLFPRRVSRIVFIDYRTSSKIVLVFHKNNIASKKHVLWKSLHVLLQVWYSSCNTTTLTPVLTCC